jgi:hypothetical protein
MKKILIVFIYLIISSSFLIGQVALITEGTVVNNALTDTWDGVNIQRNTPTSFTYRNNSITSLNNFGYMLQAGDEGECSYNNNLDGEIISGNKFIWNGSEMTSITHGVFTGYNLNAIIKYNYLLNVPMGIIRKSNGMTNTSGGVAYNIIISPNTGVVVKGMNGVNIYNNTFYSIRTTSQTWRPLIDIYANDSFSPAIVSSGTRIKNNIFYTKYQVYNISLESESAAGFESDYNIFYCESGTPMFKYGPTGNLRDMTFSQWQALGYDVHSVVINPNFINTTDFVPVSRLDYGTDLGTAWQTGLSVTAAWTVGVTPSTANQNGKWQVGARVYEASNVIITPDPTPTPTPTTDKMKLTIFPNPVHRIVNLLIEYTGTFSIQDAASSPQVMRIFDISGKLFIEKLLITGVSNIKIPINLRTGIYTVMMFSGGLQMASQKIMVY